MKFFEFIKRFQSNPQSFSQHPCILFTGSAYPLLFFTHLATLINKKEAGFLTIFDLAVIEEAQARAQLQTTFLGMQRMYWCGSVSALDTNAQKSWRRFLAQYNGPNTILMYAEEAFELDAHALIIELPQAVDKKAFPMICALVGLPVNRSLDEFTKTLFDRVQTVSLENSCLLAQYAGLIGTHTNDFFEHWFDKLVVSDSSLFTLSQYFFAQDAQAFFAYWAKVHEQFGEPFWVTFWSEQLFRAHAFVSYMKQNKRAEANRISYKLPFSFMQRDWKKYDPQAFKEAHELLYHFDYQFKNGGSAYGLDLFYTAFFQKNRK